MREILSTAHYRLFFLPYCFLQPHEHSRKHRLLAGWKVAVFWKCELNNAFQISRRLDRLLSKDGSEDISSG
jgi:hypothetical protein